MSINVFVPVRCLWQLGIGCLKASGQGTLQIHVVESYRVSQSLYMHIEMKRTRKRLWLWSWFLSTENAEINVQHNIFNATEMLHTPDGRPTGLFYTLGNSWRDSRDRIVVSTSRCGRDNPGSNPGHGRGCAVSLMACQLTFFIYFHEYFTLENILSCKKFTFQLIWNMLPDHPTMAQVWKLTWQGVDWGTVGELWNPYMMMMSGTQGFYHLLLGSSMYNVI